MRRESEETWRGGQCEKQGISVRRQSISHHIATNLHACVYVYGGMTKFAQLYRSVNNAAACAAGIYYAGIQCCRVLGASQNRIPLNT